MNFQLNKNLGNWLIHLNGKTVDRIFQVDFNKDRNEDIYLPWLLELLWYDNQSVKQKFHSPAQTPATRLYS